MTFAARLTRMPLAFDPETGAQARAAFADLAPELGELIAGAAGSSPYLRGLLDREGAWLRGAFAQAPENVLAGLLAVEGEDEASLRAGLRQAKRRLALYTGLADLGGVWQLEEVTGALTRLADHAVEKALRFQVAREIRRGKLPGQSEDDIATCAGAVALAMGKGGAFELNYSSDIDLIMLFDESRYAPDDFLEARAALVRAVRRMVPMLSELTEDGYVFRTDLRLRPDPAVTPVILSMEAAERYYESLGRTWERAAYIKARAAAGDIAAGEAFLERLTPFVWRKHLDFAAIQDAHDMRLRIRSHKGTGGRVRLEGHDMKLGRGGIREIEFFTQTRQLIAGGRDPSLRKRGTVEGLEALNARGWVPDDVARTLIGHYRRHREIEHRLQMVRDQQTHKLPGDADGFTRLACLLGEGDVARMREHLAQALDEVHELTEGFFAPEAAPRPLPEMSEASAEVVDRWRSYPALRSPRAVAIFERLLPSLLQRLEAADRPREALLAFDGFLAGLPAGVQLFSLFEANPHLVDLIIDIAATAPELARYLGQHSQVLDAVIGGDFFTDWPGQEALTAALGEQLAKSDDYELQLDVARRWAREWHFRIGVHHLRGLITAGQAGAQYAELAGAVIAGLWPAVVSMFATRHGPPPGRGAAVLGMGGLGAGRLHAKSDLDLILLYDAQGMESSEGRKPLASRAYYARLAQAFITALTAPTAEGRLYEVDMRLRPSGRQGPVATSLQSFRDYQMNEAWTWEHLALTRARAMVGETGLVRDIEKVRREVLQAPHDQAKILADVSDMRARIAAAKGDGSGSLDVKIGAGRLQDIELVGQCAALLAGAPVHDTAAQLAAGGWISDQDARILAGTHGYFWTLQVALRLLSDRTPEVETLGEGARRFVLREAECDDIAELVRHLDARAGEAAGIIGALLAPESERST